MLVYLLIIYLMSAYLNYIQYRIFVYVTEQVFNNALFLNARVCKYQCLQALQPNCKAFFIPKMLITQNEY